MTAILTLHVIIFLAVLAGHATVYRANLFHPSVFYLLFHFTVFVLRPILVTAFSFDDVYNYMRYFPNAGLSAQTLMITDLGLVSFVLTADLISHPYRKLASIWRRDQKVRVEADVRRVFNAITIVLGGPVLLSLISAVTHPIARAHEGAMTATEMTVDPATGYTTYTNNTGYFADLQTLAGSLCLSWAFLRGFRPVHLIPFAVYVLIRATEGGGRFAFLLLSAALGLAFLLHRREVFPTGRLVMTWMALGAVLFSLFAAIGNDRKVVRRALGLMSSTEHALYDTDSRSRNLLNSSIMENDFANFEFLEYVVHAVPRESRTYSYFRQYADLFIWPIPRMLWPGKPVLGALNPIQLNDYGNFRALTLSLVGDGWMSLGYMGVVITLGAAGALCGFFYNAFAAGGYRSPVSALAYCTFLVLTPQWFRDGGVTIVLFSGEQLVVFALWFLLLQRTRMIRDRRQWALQRLGRTKLGGRFTRATTLVNGWRGYGRR